MTTDHKRAHQNAYNEFIANFCERHEQCQATRDEAHEIADRATEMGRELGAFAAKWKQDEDALDDMIDAVDMDEARDVFFAAAWMAYAEGVK